MTNYFVEDRKLYTPVLNTSTHTYQVVDFVGDAFESENSKTVKDTRDFPDNDRHCFVVQMRTQSFRTSGRYIFR